MSIFSWLFNRPKAVKSDSAAKPQPAQAQSLDAQPELRAAPQIRRDKIFLTVESLISRASISCQSPRSGRALGETLILQRVGEVTENPA